MGEKEKGKGNEDKITRPESKPEPSKNIITEGKTRPDKQETFSDEWNPKDGTEIIVDDS